MAKIYSRFSRKEIQARQKSQSCHQLLLGFPLWNITLSYIPVQQSIYRHTVSYKKRTNTCALRSKGSVCFSELPFRPMSKRKLDLESDFTRCFSSFPPFLQQHHIHFFPSSRDRFVVILINFILMSKPGAFVVVENHSSCLHFLCGAIAKLQSHALLFNFIYILSFSGKHRVQQLYNSVVFNYCHCH